MESGGVWQYIMEKEDLISQTRGYSEAVGCLIFPVPVEFGRTIKNGAGESST